MIWNGKEEERPLNIEEMKKLFDSLKDKSLKALLSFGSYTGIRFSELKQVRSDLVNYETSSMPIWDSYTGQHRAVFLCENLLWIMREYREMIQGVALFPYSDRQMLEHTKRIFHQGGMKERSWKAIRRSFVMAAMETGWPMEVVIQNTGEPPESIYAYFRARPNGHASLKSPFLFKSLHQSLILKS